MHVHLAKLTSMKRTILTFKQKVSWIAGFTAFIFAVLVFTYLTFPVDKFIDARNWEAIPCIITDSGVVWSTRSNRRLHIEKVRYTYQFGGATYSGERYKFLRFASGYSEIKALVDQYPPGTKTTCYVNPKNPADSVIIRGFTPDMWILLFPLSLICFSVYIICLTIRAETRVSRVC